MCRMQTERRVPRHAFGGVAEISVLHAKASIIAPTAEISRFGCFVRTCAFVPVGTKLSLKITYDGSEVIAPGEVIYILPEKGMGIEFAEIAAQDEALLEAWLK